MGGGGGKGGGGNATQPGYATTDNGGGFYDFNGNFFAPGSNVSSNGQYFDNGLGQFGPSAGGGYNTYGTGPSTGGGGSAYNASGWQANAPGSFGGGYQTDGSGGGGGGGGGFNWNTFLPIFGQIISAYGAYKSSAANQKSAAGGPVLPKDVQASRLALGDQFLKMILTPGGLDYGPTPFNLNIGEGNDPFKAVNDYRTSSAPGFTDELNKSLDTEKAKLGGQYGIRFGTDLQRGLGDTITQATNSREATLGQLGVSSYDSFMQRRLAELGLKTDDYRKQKLGLLPLIANYLSGQPSSSPYQGGSPGGQALQSLGGGLANAPLYQYLNSQDRR